MQLTFCFDEKVIVGEPVDETMRGEEIKFTDLEGVIGEIVLLQSKWKNGIELPLMPVLITEYQKDCSGVYLLKDGEKGGMYGNQVHDYVYNNCMSEQDKSKYEYWYMADQVGYSCSPDKTKANCWMKEMWCHGGRHEPVDVLSSQYFYKVKYN